MSEKPAEYILEPVREIVTIGNAVFMVTDGTMRRVAFFPQADNTPRAWAEAQARANEYAHMLRSRENF